MISIKKYLKDTNKYISEFSNKEFDNIEIEEIKKKYLQIMKINNKIIINSDNNDINFLNLFEEIDKWYSLNKESIVKIYQLSKISSN